VTDAPTVLLSPVELTHLDGLLTQFLTLLDAPSPTADPAVARLVPAAYREDASAAAEFRRLTEGDLLATRRRDAEAVRSTLEHAETAASDLRAVVLDDQAAQAWLRTLTALRLVLADRLGIVTDADIHPEDPRFAVYEWVGYRLELLLQELDA
jgi:hypothetical protein